MRKSVLFALLSLLFINHFATAQSVDETYDRKMSRQDSIEKSLLGKIVDLDGLKTLDRKTIRMEDLKGKPTWINFWFATCRPCIDEMPVLDSIGKLYAGKANFISITFETTEKAELVIRKHGFGFLPITNAKAFIDQLGLASFPVNMFLDKEGKLVSIKNGIPYTIANGQMSMGDGAEFISVFEKLF